MNDLDTHSLLISRLFKSDSDVLRHFPSCSVRDQVCGLGRYLLDEVLHRYVGVISHNLLDHDLEPDTSCFSPKFLDQAKVLYLEKCELLADET